MTDRNVNVRLAVIDGGKVRAELNAVGTEGAAAIDKLSARSQQAAASVNKLRTHEVGNLAAQLSDIGVSLASGQSPFTVLIQQGAQISQIMGDRGVKGILGAVGQGLLSLINPTTLALGGLAAAGYLASFAIDALSGDGDDLNKVLDENKQATDDFAKSMDKAGKGAENFAQQIREVTTLQATENLRKLTEAYDEWSQKFSSGFSMPSVDPLGNITGGDEINQRFAPFEDAIRRFQASVAAGIPDVEDFARAVAKIGAASPELAKLATELINAAEQGGTLSRSMELAEARVAALAGTATDAQRELLGLSASLDGINSSIAVLAKLQAELKASGSEREKFIQNYVRQGQGGPDWILEGIEKEAGALFDRNKKLADAKKATNSFATEQARFAKEVMKDTRTATEAYSFEIERLSKLLKAGAIDQVHFNRAANEAAEDMEKAQRAVLDRKTDAGSGFTRAIDDYMKSARDMASATEDLTNDVLDGLGDAFARFATTGKLSFSDLTQSIISDLTKLATQKLLTMLLGSLFPGAGGAPIGVVGGAGPMVVPTFRHSGGLVGAGGGNRGAFPAELFLNAPRFHGGGGFLAPDERPAILQVGERVLSRAEVANGGKPQLNVKVFNNVAGNVETRTEQIDEATLGVHIDARIGDYMGSERSNNVMRGKNGITPRRIIRGGA